MFHIVLRTLNVLFCVFLYHIAPLLFLAVQCIYFLFASMYVL